MKKSQFITRSRTKSLNGTPTAPLRPSTDSHSPFKSLTHALKSITYNSNSYFV